MKNIKNKPESAKFSGIFSAQIKKNVKFRKKSETNSLLTCTYIAMTYKNDVVMPPVKWIYCPFLKEKEENDEKICEIPQKSAKF